MTMGKVGITVKDLFDWDTGALDQLSTVESNETFTNLRAVLAKKAPGVTWRVASEEIMQKTGDLLDLTIPEIAVAAWIKCREISQYADTKRYPPSETTIVPLVKHTITSVHNPYIELLVGNEPIGRVEFEIELNLTLEGVLLHIQDGEIVKIDLGSCQGTGCIKCEGVVVAKSATRDLQLPGSIPLNKGIPIAAGLEKSNTSLRPQAVVQQ
jgi:hypothetical protein